MKIAIDCRYYGKSGIGRVLTGLLDNLSYDMHEFFLVGSNKLKDIYPKAIILENNTDPFSKSGILKINKEINSLCDLIIIPNFIIPYGIKIPVYSFIHDLIFLDMKETTTKGFVDYNIKKHLFKRCFKKSKKIFCVSNFTLDRCKYYFPKYSAKLVLSYIGLSKEIIEYGNKNINVEKENNIIFVGNVKPHKGISTLLEVFSKLDNTNLKLKIIGEKENFLVGINYDESKYQNVVFTGRLSDDELLGEISKAKYLVQPSLYEGFGIPPLEAIYLGTIPVIRDIPVFEEIYNGLSVIYFKTNEELEDILSSNKQITLSSREEIMTRYNYKKLAGIVLTTVEE